MSSVYQSFSDSAARYADHDFLHIPAVACHKYHDGPIDLSYRQANEAVESLLKQIAHSAPDDIFGFVHHLTELRRRRGEVITMARPVPSNVRTTDSSTLPVRFISSRKRNRK